MSPQDMLGALYFEITVGGGWGQEARPGAPSLYRGGIQRPKHLCIPLGNT